MFHDAERNTDIENDSLAAEWSSPQDQNRRNAMTGTTAALLSLPFWLENTGSLPSTLVGTGRITTLSDSL